MKSQQDKIELVTGPGCFQGVPILRPGAGERRLPVQGGHVVSKDRRCAKPHPANGQDHGYFWQVCPLAQFHDLFASRSIL